MTYSEQRDSTLKEDDERLFIDSIETMKLFNLPKMYLYTFVEKDNPTHIIGFQQGVVFDSSFPMTVARDIQHYKIYMSTEDAYSIYADSDETAIYMVQELFVPELVKSLVRVFISEHTIWKP
jgi:hypothetical protein